MFQEKLKQRKKESSEKFEKSKNENLYKLVDKCLEFETISYYKFLITKISLQQIKHRKIIQRIFTNYIPQLKLILDSKCLIYSIQDSQKIDQTLFKQLEQILLWPQNLQYLILDLSQIYCYGKNMDIMKNLSEGIQYLPSYLKSLEIYYQGNQLGMQKENMKYLQVIMKYLPKNLQYFLLSLKYNNFGYYQKDDLKYISNALKQLPVNLKDFVFKFDYYQIGQNQQYLEEFGNVLKSHPKIINLRINLNLNDDCLENYKQIFMYLEDVYQQIPNLDLKIKFECQGDLSKQIADLLKNIPNNIQDLKLGFFQDPMGITSVDYIGKGLYDLTQNQKNLDLELIHSFLWGGGETMKDIVEGLKYIPQSIRYLKLDFQESLGNYQENLKYLSDSLKQLPNSLVKFELILQGTNLGQNQEDFKYLSEGLKQLHYNLQNLQLDLSKNTLIGQNIENIMQIGEALKQLPINLQQLQISLWGTDLGINEYNLKYLGESFNQLPQKLKFLSMDLSNNKLGENINYLSQGIKQLRIKNLEIDLGNNQLGLDFKESLKHLGEQLNQIKSLQDLQIDLSQNQIVGNIEKQAFIEENFQVLQNKLLKFELKIEQNFQI